MHIERGSTWNKWDFHVHTPYSVLNNDYGFNPDPEWKNDILEFDNYVKTLFSKAIEKEIVAIGITDYFSIDGYKRIRQAYLDNPEKMEELFPNQELRSSISNIYVFPNIEFRINTFIGKEANPVNYHVLFSDEVEISDIETAFLCQLQLEHTIGGLLPLCRDSIEKIGARYKLTNEETGSNYRVGMNHIAVDEKSIRNLLRNDLFKDKHFISVPIDEDLSDVSWKGRDYTSRRILCQQSHFLMTSNIKTREWALGRDGIEAQINEFGSLKACIWGSDAHNYDQMFCPAENRFCWIKGEPTHEGLQQVIYEPADRVRIQIEKPEEKDGHQIIDHIVFEDDDFPNKPIYFNEGLNCIIGGKSTGKSILLRHIAKSIDRKIVEKREGEVGQTRYLDVKATVTWKDGESGERKIVYVPQSWLNRTVDEQGGNSEINSIIQDVLLQDEEIGRAYRDLSDGVSNVLYSLKHDILSYISAINGAEEKEELLKTEGRPNSFAKSVNDIENKRNELTEAAGITQEDIIRYSQLESAETEIVQKIFELETEQKIANKLVQPFVYIPDFTTITCDEKTRYDFEDLPSAKAILESASVEMNEAIKPIWEKTLSEAKSRWSVAFRDAKRAETDIKDEINPLRKRIAINEDLKKIEKQLLSERERQKVASSREKERDEYYNHAKDYRNRILDSRKKLREMYEQFSSSVSRANQEGTDLLFEACVDIKQQDLFDSISSIFNTRNFRAFQEKYGVDIQTKDSFVVDDNLFVKLFEGIENNDIVFKGGFNKQTALEQLFSDWFFIHFTVMSDRDTIDTMSPGKKALVLLELIVNLERGCCPILIDQPEDDLDNRSIYTDLVKYLKEKKHERQIIVVTHNANVVVGADAEEVIIANQDGQETENYSRRFEYRCGAIENVSPVIEVDGTIRKGVLNQKGIQEQICDILEGGKDAFEKRANKYFSKMQTVT